MKFLFTLTLFFLLPLFSFTQIDSKIKQIWVSPNLYFLDLRQNDIAYFDYGMGYHEKYELEMNDSIFKLVFYDRIAGIEEKRRVVKSYKIVKLTKDSLWIQPTDKYSKLFVESNRGYSSMYHTDKSSVTLTKDDVYLFFSESSLYDENLQFEELYFSSTPCFGTCPAMQFSIDSTRTILFHGKMYVGKYVGDYKGQLKKRTYGQFIEILKSSALDYMPRSFPGGIDAPNYYLKVKYNNRHKEMIGGSFVRYFNRPLFKFLLHIFKKVKMKKTSEFTFPAIPHITNDR